MFLWGACQTFWLQGGGFAPGSLGEPRDLRKHTMWKGHFNMDPDTHDVSEWGHRGYLRETFVSDWMVRRISGALPEPRSHSSYGNRTSLKCPTIPYCCPHWRRRSSQTYASTFHNDKSTSITLVSVSERHNTEWLSVMYSVAYWYNNSPASLQPALPPLSSVACLGEKNSWVIVEGPTVCRNKRSPLSQGGRVLSFRHEVIPMEKRGRAVI